MGNRRGFIRALRKEGQIGILLVEQYLDFCLDVGDNFSIMDRGSIVDEYQSVPEYHGPLPPGDVVALSANPTVVARLTGAEPARVRAVARTATSPAELPPAPELFAQLANVLGLEGAGRP